MLRRRSFVVPILLLAVATLTAGCAATRERGGARIAEPAVFVENDLSIAISVWVARAGGIDPLQLGIDALQLGTVAPNRDGCLTIPEDVIDPVLWVTATHDQQEVIARTVRTDWRSRRGWAIHVTIPPSNLLTPTPSSACVGTTP